jgi:two-component system, chemotaxis family, chemotaxis protein CheY
MKILLVDDSRTMRNIQKKILEAKGGIEFLEAGDGVEALAALAGAGGSADLALVDWNMPNMDGITFVKKVRETNKTMPMIMVTTEAEKTRVVDAIKAGVNNYVIKPFTPEGLTEKVDQTLAKVQTAAAA